MRKHKYIIMLIIFYQLTFDKEHYRIFALCYGNILFKKNCKLHDTNLPKAVKWLLHSGAYLSHMK